MMKTCEMEPSGSSDWKIVVVGDSKCGKTALLQRFVNDKFPEVYVPTGFEKYSHFCEIGDKKINFTLWDTSGSPQYDNIRHLAYQEARLFIVCFHIGQPQSLENVLTKWYPEIRAHCPAVPLVLCGCQSDVRTSSSNSNVVVVRTERVQSICEQIGAVNYAETCSVFSGQSVKDILEFSLLLLAGKTKKNKNGGVQRNRSFTRVKFQTKVDLKAEIKQKAKSCVIM